MLQKIIRFSVNNKLTISIFMLAWIIFGAYHLSKLPIDAVPDITNNQVQVITTAPALGAEDVERFITFPLEQAFSNIPHLKESRSISRFGLSLITIVFEDDADVYWARQQVTERINQVAISENASKPELAPVSTGLGEIYQYVLQPKKGFENKYSLDELRSIQDWLVRRQLLGTPGVADVSTFGGLLKQYEVAIKPDLLKSLNITITDIFTALHSNNSNTGGAYIEKGPSVLYIRSNGLAKTSSDIEQIVVKNLSNGSPILIKDVATVKIGSAIRYGALTSQGKGEVTGGIVMMLKGENTSDVIEHVKNKIVAIEKTLPEGLEIEPFLDRTKMVNNAINTVKTNLLEGALIVVLVLVIFLGNFRAGFIVASVIPLAMLFAIAMMNLFGVSGNLMSLGALDFGLIVDGAVIIVESVLHHLHHSKKYKTGGNLTQDNMNEEVTTSASSMMNAAVFGQIIILIVYLPILSLQGIEGKMFKPMAQTVAFAILGAFILSLTYVPMISAVFLSKKINPKPNIAERIFQKIELRYKAILTKFITKKKIVIISVFTLFTVSVFLFTKMGGEFIPQLEEGDFAVETRLLVGTNLTTTIKTINQISDILKQEFPEVKQVVARIGSAEIPTDPMPIEGGDIIIVLKDKKQWTSARSFPDLATKMNATIQSQIPGVSLGFQFPVQMRFNELMTGAKQDVVCKIYGEDLNMLAKYADKIGDISKTVSGTADWYVEKVTGMPQIVIDFNRTEIARYGLSIDEINKTINAAFAGAVAGQIYEGEKKFDLVVRIDEMGRRDMNDVSNLLIATPNGLQVPLYQLATVSEIEGPNQIQRENAKRRIMVGFNVRGRDVASIVEELSQKIANQIKFEPGYYTHFGGAFENLQQAKARLSIAVPVALILIFGMLYFAFKSVKEGLLIFTAIPLSAIGGILALELRGMPFSISAGVGFIALFGVAVLNGIVLISEFKRLLKEDPNMDILHLVIQGATNRLRPVLMTAAVASLGFLPMALSNGAGAEVQRPLATVVIGGLITATFLTLFVLPILYILFNRKKLNINKTAVASIFLLFATAITWNATAQKNISLPESIAISIQNNKKVKGAILNSNSIKALTNSAYSIPKTSLGIEYGQLNSIKSDTKFSISQDFKFPTIYAANKRLLEQQYDLSKINNLLVEQDIKSLIRTSFYDYNWLYQKKKLLIYADSIYQAYHAKATLRFNRGASNLLELTAAKTLQKQVSNQLLMVDKDLEIVTLQFNFLLQDTIQYLPEISDAIDALVAPNQSLDIDNNKLPIFQSQSQKLSISKQELKIEKLNLFPEFGLGYSNQSIIGYQTINGLDSYYGSNKRFSSINLNVSVPLFQTSNKARIKSAQFNIQKENLALEYLDLELKTSIAQSIIEINKYKDALAFYQQQGLENSNLIVKTADLQFINGEIDYLQWTLLINNAISIQSDYLDLQKNYYYSIINLLKIKNL